MTEDVRETAAQAAARIDGWLDWSLMNDNQQRFYLRLADAVLAAVEPVIRRQERAAVAEEIARAIWDAPVRRYGVFDRYQAAAIARFHSTQLEGQDQ